MTNDPNDPPLVADRNNPGQLLRDDESGMTVAERFAYHPPSDRGVVATHERIRRAYSGLAHILDSQLVNGRTKDLALAALEESLMRANQSVAFHQTGSDGSLATRGEKLSDVIGRVSGVQHESEWNTRAESTPKVRPMTVIPMADHIEEWWRKQVAYGVSRSPREHAADLAATYLSSRGHR